VDKAPNYRPFPFVEAEVAGKYFEKKRIHIAALYKIPTPVHAMVEVIIMKKFELAVVLGLMAAIFCGNMAEFAGHVSGLEDSVLRLHILANSDSEEDQMLKLKVRDALLAESDALFAGCNSPEDIRARAVEVQESVRLLAQAVVEEHGSDAQVRVQLVEMDFDARQYEEITMPAGTYDALRILIGEGAGKNWWCVMYPPLCIPAGAEVTADTDNTALFFDPETLSILEDAPRYAVKFRCLEVWEEMQDTLEHPAAPQFRPRPQHTEISARYA